MIYKGDIIFNYKTNAGYRQGKAFVYQWEQCNTGTQKFYKIDVADNVNPAQKEWLTEFLKRLWALGRKEALSNTFSCPAKYGIREDRTSWAFPPPMVQEAMLSL